VIMCAVGIRRWMKTSYKMLLDHHQGIVVLKHPWNGLLALVVVIPCHGFGVRYNKNRPMKRRGAMDSSLCGFECNAARVTVRHFKFDVPAKLGIV